MSVYKFPLNVPVRANHWAGFPARQLQVRLQDRVLLPRHRVAQQVLQRHHARGGVRQAARGKQYYIISFDHDVQKRHLQACLDQPLFWTTCCRSWFMSEIRLFIDGPTDHGRENATMQIWQMRYA